MRFQLFLALVVATFIASCFSFTNADNADLVDNLALDSDPEMINTNELGRRLKGSRKLAEEWWVTDANDEERVLGAKNFVSKIKGQVAAKKAAQAAGTMKGTETLTKAQMNQVSSGVAKAVKKDRKVWPVIKKSLKYLYGITLATLILTAAIAMYKLYA